MAKYKPVGLPIPVATPWPASMPVVTIGGRELRGVRSIDVTHALDHPCNPPIPLSVPLIQIEVDGSANDEDLTMTCPGCTRTVSVFNVCHCRISKAERGDTDIYLCRRCAKGLRARAVGGFHGMED